MDPRVEANREFWDELAPLHAASECYDVGSFRAGVTTLSPLERGEVGEVAGKRLLHLQCHFGLDTLSWARLGAEVTGVDFSERGIEIARELAAELGIEARFVCANVLDLPSALSGAFDVVFASYGVLVWIPDVARWAEVAASFVAPGGFLYLVDGHPVARAVEERNGCLELARDYFVPAEGEAIARPGSYAVPEAKLRARTSYEFRHNVGDVVTAVAATGLTIEFVREHPVSPSRYLDSMRQGDDGLWRLPDAAPSVPLVLSIRARKPA
jgi:SAM-dependent methyltransferase